jgi:pimeloyl-ACP methyl ester carboxylesterase
LNYEHAVRAIIRPPRASYTTVDLGPPEFVLPGGDPKVRYRRSDAELVNGVGATLQCSHWEPVHRPRAPDGRPVSVLPCVVYLHGNSSCRVAAMEVLPLVLAAGWTCVAFDFMGCGRSDGEWVTLGHTELADLQRVLAALRERGPAASELGMSGRATGRVVLYGRSMGAVTAILAAARDPSIAAVVADSPFSSLRGLIDELLRRARSQAGCAGALLPGCVLSYFLQLVRRTVRERTGMDLNDLAPAAAAPRCAQPALFCAGSEDLFVSPGHARACCAAWGGKDKEFFPLPGCDHNTVRPVEWHDKVRALLARAVEGASPPPPPPAPAAARTPAPATPATTAAAPPPPPSSSPSKRVSKGGGMPAVDATLALRGAEGGAGAAPQVRPPPVPAAANPLSPTAATAPPRRAPTDALALALASSPETGLRWAGMRVARGRGAAAGVGRSVGGGAGALGAHSTGEEGEEDEGGKGGEVVAGEGVVLVIE